MRAWDALPGFGRVEPSLDIPGPFREPEIPGSGRILVVDDDELACRLLARLLDRAGHSCEVASDAAEARVMLAAEPFDLVLTDMDMPGESGADLILDITREHGKTAVIMVTGHDDPTVAALAIERGAYGFVIKPFRATEILIAVSNALRRQALEVGMREANALLEQIVSHRTSELRDAIRELQAADEEIRLSRAETIHRLAIAAEFRDGPTGRHVEMMSRYCALIARHLGASRDQQEEIRLASLMHDIGKIGVPDRILLKPGQLDPDEWQVMKQHTELGYRILCDSGSDLLHDAASIALTHHERVDGTGYPQGLRAEEIPLEGRVAAVADVFDALVSDRPYRKAFPLGEAREMIRRSSGTHLDPEVVGLFLDSWEEVVDLRDEADELPKLSGGDRASLERRR